MNAKRKSAARALSLPNVANRCFNRPLLLAPQKFQVILGVLTPRLGIAELAWPDADLGARTLSAQDLVKLAEAERAALGPKAEGPARAKAFDLVGGIAVIEVVGTLVNKLGSLDPYSGMTGYDGLRVKLREAVADPEVAGILFDIDSSGGEVAGCFDLVDEIYAARAKKPIWAVATENAFSAAYAIASAAERIFVPRTGGVGSIGVICGHVDWSKHLEDHGIKVTMIFAGARKADGSPYAPLSDEAYAWIKAEIDRTYELFCSTVARNRDMDVAKVRKTEAGCFFGENAVSIGLADEVAAPTEILERMVVEVTSGTARGAAGNPTTGKESAMKKGSKQASAARAAADEAKEKETAQGAETDEEQDAEAEAETDEEHDDAAAAEEGEDETDEDEERDPAVSARTAERKRIAAILGAPAAKGREQLAQALALETELDVKAAIAVLERSPKGSGQGALAAAMAGQRQPNLRPAAGDGGDDVDAVARRIAAYSQPARRS